MIEKVARPERGGSPLLGTAALVAVLGLSGPALAQANPSTVDSFEAVPSEIQSPTGADAVADDPDPATGQTNGDTRTAATGDSAGVTYYDAPLAMFATTSSRVRSGPGTGHDLVGTIPYAAEVSVLGEAGDGGWVYLQMGDGTRGFTASRLLSAAQPAASSSVDSPQGASSATVVPTCISGEVLIQLGNGQAICAVLQ